MYSFRLIFFCLMNFCGFMILNISESLYMLLPMMSLLFMSIIGGSFLSWLIFPFFSLILLTTFMKFLVLIICFLGGMLGYFLFSINFIYKLIYLKFFIFFKNFFSLMWFMPLIFSFGFNIFFMKVSNNYKNFIDYGWMEYIGGSFFKKMINYLNYFNFVMKFLNFYFLMLLLFIIFIF